MRIELPRRALKGALATMLICLAAAATSEELFSLEDVFELEWATDPRPAPDGEAVVYVRNFYDRAADRQRSNLWWIDLDSGAQRALTTGLGSNGSPRFPPAAIASRGSQARRMAPRSSCAGLLRATSHGSHSCQRRRAT